MNVVGLFRLAMLLWIICVSPLQISHYPFFPKTSRLDGRFLVPASYIYILLTLFLCCSTKSGNDPPERTYPWQRTQTHSSPNLLLSLPRLLHTRSIHLLPTTPFTFNHPINKNYKTKTSSSLFH